MESEEREEREDGMLHNSGIWIEKGLQKKSENFFEKSEKRC